MIINHNMNAMNAHRLMTGNTAQAGKSMEKLSSGLRINRAGDDAAGLAISEKMRAQIRGLDQAQRNSQDGISMIQTAEGALNETHSILQRMRELATQSASDTNVTVDREEIQKEINQLTSEINRIGNTTEFNTQKVLEGRELTGEAKIQNTKNGVKIGDITSPAVAGKSVAATAADLGANTTGLTGASLKVTVGGKDYTLSNDDIIALKDKSEAEAATYIADKAVNGADKLSSVANVSFDKDGKLTVESKTAGVGNVTMAVTDGTAGTGTKTAADALGVGTAVDTVGVDATLATADVKGEATITIEKNFAEGERIEINGKTYTAIASDAKTVDENQFKVGADEEETAANLLDAMKNDVDSTSAIDSTSKNVIKLVEKEATSTTEAFKLDTEGADFKATLQIGANEGQAFQIEIKDMRSAALGISGEMGATPKEIGDQTVPGKAAFSDKNNVTNGTENGKVEAALDVLSHDTASSAIKVINNAIENVSAERSKLGAYQNRLEHTINNLGTASENLTASESRIRDVDMAKEMMTFSKKNILSQAAQAMLAQANQQPQGVLQLLR